MLPNFLVIGVQRSATTWLFKCLQEHPEVFVPEEKELHFFTTHFEKGLDWYESHFRDAEGFKAVGELTPAYLHEAPIERIAEVLPDAKLIAILRHPVDRAFSAYRLLNGQLRGTFEEEFRTRPYLRTRSMYADALERVIRVYGRERTKVLLYDDVLCDPAGVLRTVFEFIGVDASFVPTASGQTFNHVLYPRTQRALEAMGLEWVIRSVRGTGFGRWLKGRSRVSNGRSSPQAPRHRATLEPEFRDDLLRVEQLTGLDLARWM